MKKYNVTLIRSTLWSVEVEETDPEAAESKVLEMETKELIEACSDCETTDIYCHVEKI